MAIFALILMIAAFVLFVLGAIPISHPRAGSLLPAGLACWSLAEILTHWVK